MLESMESFVTRLLPAQAGQRYEVTRLHGGLGGVNFRVTSLGSVLGQDTQLVVTLFFDPATWWKIDQAYAVRAIVGDDADVLLPEIIDSGEDRWGRQPVAFLLREFVAGQDLDSVLAGGLRDQDRADLARDLGSRIGAVHAHALSGFGLIAGAEGQRAHCPSWRDFFQRELERMMGLLRAYPPEKQLGDYRVDDVVSLFPALEKWADDHSGALETVEVPRLAHGDARLANVIVAAGADGRWGIKALIDWEWALAGDPEVDLVCVESWLYSSTYQARFYQARRDFMAGYNLKCSLSPHYGEKRALYHALRSLSYLGAVFALNPRAFVRANLHNVRYVEKNCRILHALAHSYGLEHLGILSLGE
jgi:aminoglycoside phosphotransferase (APT) family kinase protein